MWSDETKLEPLGKTPKGMFGTKMVLAFTGKTSNTKLKMDCALWFFEVAFCVNGTALVDKMETKCK